MKGLSKQMFMRLICVLLVVCIGGFGTIIIALGRIMIVDAERYQTLAANQQLRDVTILPRRGAIYDRNMEFLATSNTVWEIFISPRDISGDEQRELVTNGLSEILDVDHERVLELSERNSQFEIVKRRVERPEADAVRAFIREHRLGSIIGINETTTRYYPHNNLASTVLGFVGTDNQGLSGIEARYDAQLRGVEGRLLAAKNARGAEMPFSYQRMVDPVPGSSLVLTIDLYIQHFIENALERAVIGNNVQERGVAIAMNVNTGEILGMATKPDFNPNDPFTIYAPERAAMVEAIEDEDERRERLQYERNRQWRNQAISDAYYPGSVFKMITGAAAIEQNRVQDSTTFSCPGHVEVSGTRFHCHRRTGHGTVNLKEAFQNSCNPAFIVMGERLGPANFFNYFRAFGLTERTRIDLPGEGDSQFLRTEQLRPVELASSSFGQTIVLTPIQMITAIAATVNGGYVVQPHVVSQILDADGNVLENTRPNVRRQAISRETSDRMNELYEAIVTGGSGRNAYVAGFRVGGKTGTSQKQNLRNEHGEIDRYVSSFVGIAPMNDPEIAVLVLLDEPNVANFFGSAIAAPVVGEIFAEALPHLGIEEHFTAEELAERDLTTPSLIGRSVEEANAELRNMGLVSRTVGDGDTVVRQMPFENQSIPRGGTVVLHTTQSEQDAQVNVPNFIGMTPAQVNAAGVNAGVNVRFNSPVIRGTGAIAHAQSTQAGVLVEDGTVITVYFKIQDLEEAVGGE